MGARVALGDALVTTNSAGLYNVSRPAWAPWGAINLVTTVDGFQPIRGQVSGVRLGNLLLEAGGALLFIAGGGLLLRRRQRAS